MRFTLQKSLCQTISSDYFVKLLVLIILQYFLIKCLAFVHLCIDYFLSITLIVAALDCIYFVIHVLCIYYSLMCFGLNYKMMFTFSQLDLLSEVQCTKVKFLTFSPLSGF
jgi:hypothetical protein